MVKKSKGEINLEQRFIKLKSKVESGHYSVCQFVVVLVPNYDKKPDKKEEYQKILKCMVYRLAMILLGRILEQNHYLIKKIV